MKKKIIYMLLICLITLTCTTGCFNSDELEGSHITTTVYPIEYIVSRLYPSAEVTSIYPNDTDVKTYKLTDKQLNDISKSTTLFIYNGVDEKEIARSLVDKNNNLQIIDPSFAYTYGVEELWLSPNKLLTMADTIKIKLEELSTSKYAAEEIEKNYEILEEDISTLDANLRNIAKSAQSNNKETIVIAYDAFGFLENYGFKVINISNESNITSSIKTKFKNKTYKQIFVADKNNVSDSVKDLVDNYNAELIEINTMSTLTDEERTNNDNYLTIMNDFLTDLSNIVLS